MKKKVVALMAGVMVMLTMNAMASSLKVGTSYSYPIYVLNGNTPVAEGAGSFDTSYLDERKLDYLYCVDLTHFITPGGTYSYSTENNTANIHNSTLTNAGKVAYLLGAYGTGGQGANAQALQAAIWYEISNGVYKLDQTMYTGSNSNVATLYNQYVNAADTHRLGDVSKFVWINPGTDVNGTALYQAQVTSGHAPEPSTIVLLVTGMLGMAVFGKRRMIKTAQ